MNYRRRLLLLLTIVALVVAIVGLWPEVQEHFAPVPTQAWVAIEVGDSGRATIGRVEIDAGERFRLYAVLEARNRAGERVFYTEAEGLVVDGELVPATALLPWIGQTAKVLWFTVEGDSPVFFLEEGESPSQFSHREFLRSEWGTGWTTDGSLDPAHDNHLTRSSLVNPEPFGTQRFHARIELFESATEFVPSERFASWGAEDLLEHLDRFPTVIARHPGGVAKASSFFGLTEIVADPDDQETMNLLVSLTRKGIAYSGLILLRDLLESGGRPGWELIDFESAPRWGEGLESGDLLRVGSRFVVVFEDDGTVGLLDREDRVFDFHLGPKVVRLGEVFEGHGALEWAALGREEVRP